LNLKSADNGQLLEQLKSSLLNLRLKRAELLTKFQANYPMVQEVDHQIQLAQEALTDAQRSQVKEETTDRDPNYEQVREDLTRSSSELAGLEARSIALAKVVTKDQAEVQSMHQQGLTQADLLRTAKAAEDNYLLLLHKQEEARISDELDKRRLFNVSIVEAVSVPALPVHTAPWYLVRGALLGLLFAFAVAVAADRLDPTLRTPEEVELTLGMPVLAVLPLPAAKALAHTFQDEPAGLVKSDGRIFPGI